MIHFHRSAMLLVLASLSLLGCNADVTLFNQSFINEFTGSIYPIVPGPDPGYVMVMGQNNTQQSVEFVVTAESQELTVSIDDFGQITGFDTEILAQRTVCLITDVGAPTLAVVFENSPVDWPPVPPGDLTFEQVQDVVDQLVAKDPEALVDRDTIRLLRVLRIGLGPDLDAPAGDDDGIVVRPPGSNQNTTAGLVFPSGVNDALSYDVGNDPADFGNGDMIIYLATSNASAVGGIAVSAGVTQGQADTGQYVRDTFKILRRVEGPINPLPPS